mmetsp:Transcript_42087/g.76799  ORF Transcript_42087/g.76799 Transcript_42087/m.76799 type:complete len:88 (+) Transcript_42087:2540-2803(+)
MFLSSIILLRYCAGDALSRSRNDDDDRSHQNHQEALPLELQVPAVVEVSICHRHHKSLGTCVGQDTHPDDSGRIALCPHSPPYFRRL